MIRIAIDVMGADRAPDEIIRGAHLAESPQWEYLLVGSEKIIQQHLHTYHFTHSPITIVPAEEVIESNDAPVQALKKKKNASLPVAVRLIKSQQADAVLSAGNTGAFMAAAVLFLRTIPGVARPALSPALPTIKKGKMVILLDVGANMDAEAVHLQQYGIMGSLYAEKVLNITAPRVGLLNVGSESGKGSKVVQEAHSLLKHSGIQFIGNVEARDIFSGSSDVIVCDGFVGNALLKSGEGLAETVFTMMKEEFTSGWKEKLGVMLLRPALMRIRKRIDYSEYGGAPLLGINGICIKSHGSSNAVAISNGIRTAGALVREKLLEDIKEKMTMLGGKADD